MMLFSTMVSFFLFAMGKTALRATQKQKSRVTERMFNRHFFMFLAFLVFYVFTRKQSRLFKGAFEYIQTHDNLTASYYDTDAAVVNMTTNMTETPKRNLRERFHARNDQYDNVLQQHEQMFEDIDMQFDKAFSQQIPDDFKKVMKKMKKHHNSKKHEFQRMRFEDDDHYYNHEEDHKENPLNFKRDIYRIYAPALWNKA
jgi:flagellar basal body-associated protein FliL